MNDVLIAPTVLFILALVILNFEYTNKLRKSLEELNNLKKDNAELSYRLSTLGGVDCTIKLRGLKMQIKSLHSDLEAAYTDVAYCDNTDEIVASLQAQIHEIASECESGI